jgi:hypothetical protein
MFRPLFAFACAAALSACSTPKIIISGQVFDTTGLPIERAEVSTMPPTDLVSTDRDGNFYLTRRVGDSQNPMSDIPPGVYQVRIAKEGFESVTLSVKAEKGPIWLDRQALKPERALIDTVAPDAVDDPDAVPVGGGGMMGM